ncbi:unnamed protein product [Ixodes hexagonus]
MLPPVALALAVLVFLLSVGTIIWLYVRHFRKTAFENHIGSYSPSFVQREVLGETTGERQRTCAALEEFRVLPYHVDEADSGVQLLSSTPRKVDELLRLTRSEDALPPELPEQCELPSDIKSTTEVTDDLALTSLVDFVSDEHCDIDDGSISQQASTSPSDTEGQSDSSSGSSAEYVFEEVSPIRASQRDSVAVNCDVIKEDDESEEERSDEKEHIKGSFSRNCHDETYRQYKESVLLKRRAEMYFGASGTKFRKSCFDTA